VNENLMRKIFGMEWGGGGGGIEVLDIEMRVYV
jgi:hypothetical protein